MRFTCLICALAVWIAGCGYKGPLVMPKPKPEAQKPAAQKPVPQTDENATVKQ